jgi:hypothetical protein
MPIADSTPAATPPARMASINYSQGYIVAKAPLLQIQLKPIKRHTHNFTVKPLILTWKTLQILNSDFSVKSVS